jgi:phosphate:Na+ symporter
MQHEVIEFLTDLMTGNVPHSITEEARSQLRIADELESVSDYVATILKAHLRLRQSHLRLNDTERSHRNELHEKFAQYLTMVNNAVRHNQTDVLSKALSKGDAITHRFKELRDEHLVRLTEEKVDPLESMSYNTMIGSYRKMKDHALNIAEAICGEK